MKKKIWGYSSFSCYILVRECGGEEKGEVEGEKEIRKGADYGSGEELERDENLKCETRVEC